MRPLPLFLAAAIAVFACAAAAQPTPDLFWFRFEETSGTSSTNQGTLAGSMFGGFTVTTAGLFTNGTTAATPNRIQPGAVGTGAVNLNGQSVWLDTGLPGTTLNAGSFTVECWINTGGVSQEGNTVFSICTNSALNFGLFLGSSNNRLAIEYNGALTSGVTVNLNDGNWHHVAVVYNRATSTTTGYIDGVQELQATGQNYTFSSGSNVCFFNGRTTTPFGKWNGRADEVRMHSTVIAPANFAKTLAPVTPSGGGSGDDDGEDDGGCAATHGTHWALLAPAGLMLLAARRRRRRTA